MKKIKGLKLKNFANFIDFECVFNGQITHLVGVNGSGKTTIGLTAIWACLKGIAENQKSGQLIGERFRFIGNQKPTADIELTVYDEHSKDEIIISNHISKAGNSITCEPVQDADWLNNFLSAAFLSAKNFTLKTSKEQALLLGIDTSEYDSKITELKTEYTLINREYKNFGEITEIEKAERVSIKDLFDQKDVIDRHNSEQAIRESAIEDKKDEIQDIDDTLVKQRLYLKELESSLTEKGVQLTNLKKPENTKSTDAVQKQIDSAEETNTKADSYQSYLTNKKSKDEKQKELNNNTNEQAKVAENRLKYIKSFKFGFAGLSVNENGGLLLNDRPLREPYFSKGELEIVVAKLYVSLNPELKVRFIDDFELLDEDNQVKIVEALLKEDFQIITAEVGKEHKSSNSILLRECKIVDSYKESERQGTLENLL